MRSLFFAAAFLAGFPVLATHAASLRVAPVLVDLKAPTAASTLRIWNDAGSPISVQVRIFKWSQEGGKENFTPATGVVVSPPITQLAGGGENTIRIVRTSKTPVHGEESYRVIVDELPQPSAMKSGMVTLVIRHSIPVFFSDGHVDGPKPSWSVARKSGGYEVSVVNQGDRRLRIANLELEGSGGAAIAAQSGLVGYVLGGSMTKWFIPARDGKAAGGTLTISADSDAGAINARARISGG